MMLFWKAKRLLAVLLRVVVLVCQTQCQREENKEDAMMR